MRNFENLGIPIYCSESSSLIYVLNNSSPSFNGNSEDEYNSLQLCSINKNDSAMACYKEMIDQVGGVRQKMPELFGFVDVQKVDNNETVEAVKTVNRNDQLIEDDD